MNKLPWHLSFKTTLFLLIIAIICAINNSTAASVIFIVITIIQLVIKGNQYTSITQEDSILFAQHNTLQDSVNRKREEFQTLEQETQEKLQKLEQEKNSSEAFINAHIRRLQKELNELNSELTYQYGKVDYYPNFTAEEIKNELTKYQLEEKEMIKNNKSVAILDETVPLSSINKQIRQCLHSFNAETESYLNSITAKNVDIVRNKIMKSFELHNKLYAIDKIKLNPAFMNIKLNKLNAIYQYQQRLEDEKEQRKAIKEQMLEEEKVRRELEAAKKKLEKEESQFKNEINKLMKFMQKATNDVEKNLYIDKIKDLEEELRKIEHVKQDVENREQNTRAGFVYIISNIGSFGENVYKIGMTRRLEPMDRIDELSSASVPFRFDVHALIFSNDAPGLEALLHKTFSNNQVNKVNYRKEFYNVPLEDIKDIVTKNHNATVQWTIEPKAEEYYESIKINNN